MPDTSQATLDDEREAAEIAEKAMEAMTRDTTPLLVEILKEIKSRDKHHAQAIIEGLRRAWLAGVNYQQQETEMLLDEFA